MKRKLLTLFLCLMFALPGQSARAEADPRIFALGKLAIYGAAGGALLGTAALAFGSEGRSVAKGASLGLYAGILFGTYIVLGHAMKKHQDANPAPQDNYYPESSSPYEEESESGGGGWFDFGGGDDEAEEETIVERWEPYFEAEGARLDGFKRKTGHTLIYVPVLHYQF